MRRTDFRYQIQGLDSGGNYGEPGVLKTILYSNTVAGAAMKVGNLYRRGLRPVVYIRKGSHVRRLDVIRDVPDVVRIGRHLGYRERPRVRYQNAAIRRALEGLDDQLIREGK